ncbi:MAG: SUMF1/EgtB/PvdO family nonheme iron enzyme [Planctomycetaceae bacterium]
MSSNNVIDAANTVQPSELSRLAAVMFAGICIVGVAALIFRAPTIPAGEHAPSSALKDESPAQAMTNSIGMKLARIPAGEFLMGSADDDPGAREDEKPQHSVKITKPFYMGIHEVTQAQFERMMQTNPSSFTRAGLLKDAPPELDCSRLPVDNVTWYSAVEFCRRLSDLPEEKAAGRVYRLPTEAEWEYACRAGTTSTFHYGDSLSSTEANFNGAHPYGDAARGPFLNRTEIIGSYQPNAFGLYDMHGNLHEWCLDRFDREYYRHSPTDDPRGPEKGTSRVIRGGDWYSDGRDCRSAFRYADIPHGRFYALGMRVVCELTSEGATLDPIIAAGGRTESAIAVTTAGTKLSEEPRPADGEDWPRWRGVRGDGTWNAPKLPAKWPDEGLQQVWRHELGGGYGGISVSGGRVCVMDRQRQPQDIERILCFDAVTGEQLWSHSWPVDYSGVAYDNGPRSTPTMFQGRVFALGAVGHLFCLDGASGKVLWSRDLVKEFKAQIPLWGVSASPVIYESLVIVHAGAQPDGCFLAFDMQTGEERWRSLPDAAGYATPMLIEHDSQRQLVAWTPTNVRGLEPSTGRLLWTIPFEVNYGTSISDPVFHEGLVLVSSYYEGSKAIRVTSGAEQPEVVWQDNLNLRGLMSQPLYREGHAYLIDKRHGLTCFEFATGKKIWDDDNRLTPKGRNPQATLVWLGDEDRAIVLNSDGELILIRLNSEGYVEESRTKIVEGTWAHPAYAGNCVYARGDTEIVCVLLPRGE